MNLHTILAVLVKEQDVDKKESMEEELKRFSRALALQWIGSAQLLVNDTMRNLEESRKYLHFTHELVDHPEAHLLFEEKEEIEIKKPYFPI